MNKLETTLENLILTVCPKQFIRYLRTERATYPDPDIYCYGLNSNCYECWRKHLKIKRTPEGGE
jgi:hypothetical protein